ncbi:hypothetical protein [Aquitalea pelogenes]|uniref:hypothetical protein n=1 Tax=Aquitalea pelogenes TaxID=1293573 RepID=UPI0035B33471
MARMNAQQAAEVAKALTGQNNQPTASGNLPAVSGPGGIAGGIFRGKAKEAASASGSAGLAAAYVETARTYADETNGTVMYFSHDGMFRIGMVPLKTLTIAEATSAGTAISGTAVTITFSGDVPQ